MRKRFFTDDKGNIAIVQKPNLPIIVAVLAWLLSHVLPYGQLNFAMALIAFGAFFTWSWLEMLEGASPFRRVLGAVVFLLNILARL